MKTLLFFVFINIFWVQCVLRTKVTEDILDSSIYQAKEQSFGEDNEPLLLTPLINEGNLFEARRLSKVAPNILDTLDILDSSIYQAKEQSFGEDNEPLLLTPLINEGNLFEARRLSKVAPNILDTVSYAGYFTVNKTCENHLFFWFFLAEESWEEQPVVLWLQGGPGGPSLYGLFEENGPFILVNGEPQSRPYSWNKRNNVIYIDQPVNTGYSFSGKKCYTASSRQCGIEVYSALVQFFTMFQELQDNRFYIAGESYAGHFVPHVGKAIHESNPTAKTKINLCGMMVWDPFINYIQNVNISDYLLNLGLVNRMEKQDIDARLEKYVNAMKVEPIRRPNEDEDPYFILLPVLNNISVYDYTAMEETFDLSILLSYVTQPYVRKCLHVGNVTFSLDQDYKVYDAMTVDYYTSMVSVYEELLEHYLIVAPVGQLDIICGYPMVKKILESFTWSRADQYRTAPRQRWCVDGFLAGYFTCAGGFDKEPLILTPLINEGSIIEARLQSKVTPNILDTVSYAGYFTVNKTCENHLFFWFFLAEESWEEQPVVLWLQGGPGVSSLFGLFEENGPFNLVNGEPQRRSYSWNKRNNVIYIDQPVNTGYSFSGQKCYTASSRQCGIEVYSALVQFFTMFQELQDNRFYIAGESYAGHFVPHVGKAIHESNPTAEIQINLSGIIVWSPFINYKEHANNSDYLFNLGLVGHQQKANLDERLDKYTNAMRFEPIRKPKPDESNFDLMNSLLKNVSFYDFTAVEETLDPTGFIPYVTRPNVRKSLHVGNVTFGIHEGGKIFEALELDYYTSMVSVYEELLEHYLIVAPVGQLDIICGYPMVKKILESFTWSRADQYRTAPRQRWCVDGFLAGFYTCAGNLCDVLIRDASHMAPKSQPKWSYVLMDSVTSSPVDDPMKAMTVCA